MALFTATGSVGYRAAWAGTFLRMFLDNASVQSGLTSEEGPDTFS
jgi:hypothetical protein